MKPRIIGLYCEGGIRCRADNDMIGRCFIKPSDAVALFIRLNIIFNAGV